MPEQTTETTQTQPVTTPPVVTPPATEQGTAGATTPAPSKTSTEQTTTQTPPVITTPPPTLSKEEVQKRIDRMYARLQEERKQRLAAEVQLKLKTQATTEGEVIEEGEQPPKTLTEADIEAIVERKEREKVFVASEVRVFERHPSALTEDGSFNMSDPFVQKYIEIGRRNPMLAAMENGPELAEAMADKELGIDYKKGRTAEAARTMQQGNSFTTSSTVSLPPITTAIELNATEKKIARHMKMTDAEYGKYKASNKVVQKSWEVK